MRDVLAATGLFVALCAASVAAQADETHRSSKTTPHVASLSHLCVTPGSVINPITTPECEAAFAAALKTTDEPSVTVTATPIVGPKGVQPLRFQKRAPWVRRLETLGKEGIPFVRLPQGPESELVIGINRKGMLGFQLRRTANR